MLLHSESAYSSPAMSQPRYADSQAYTLMLSPEFGQVSREQRLPNVF
jgi:hypothetical protein